jgi:lipoprotein-anchoring transpeptidase ErfK/SrfK
VSARGKWPGIRGLFWFFLLFCISCFGREIAAFSSALPIEKTALSPFFFNVVARLDENDVLRELYLKGPNLYEPVPFFRFSEEICGQATVSISTQDFTKFALVFRCENGLFEYPLFSFANLLFSEATLELELEREVTGEYTVVPGDYLYRIAQNYGTSVAFLEILNHTDPNIRPGQILKLGNIYAKESPVSLEISLSQCVMTVLFHGKIIKSYPVAVGRGQSSKPGDYFITRKIENPALYWEGEYIHPLAPINGLGTWWMELSNPQYGIHGTNRPWEIGKRISHGCIRMFNKDIEALQRILPIGTSVRIVP